MQVRLLEIEYPDDPNMSLATEEAIFHEVIGGNSPPTFRFYRHRNAVIIGCFQLAEQELDMDVIRDRKIEIVKRFTGGGAVYHDMGNLNFSLITKDVFGIKTDVTKLYSTMITGAVNAFRSMGIPAESGKLNDVTAGSKKILGAAASIRDNAFVFHAAVLVNVDLKTLASALKVPGEKLKDKGVKTIMDRVTNIQEISGKNTDDVKRALLDSYGKELNLEFVNGTLTDAEKRLAKELHEKKYKNKGWVLGREIINLY